MDRNEKRLAFLEAVEAINNYMGWVKIKLDPNDKFERCGMQQDQCERNFPIESDYVSWPMENFFALDSVNTHGVLDAEDGIDAILKIHCAVCAHFVFDDLCYFLGMYDKEKNVSSIDEAYGRNPDAQWLANRKKHNRRICFELSRITAALIKHYLDNEEYDVFLVSNENESHYATAVVCEEFSIIVDSDDFVKGDDLSRFKLGVELKGITIISDENGIVRKAIEQLNSGRKMKIVFENEERSAMESNFKSYVASAMARMDYQPRAILEFGSNVPVEAFYSPWNFGFLIVKANDVNYIGAKDFFDGIQEGKYVPREEYNG